MFKLGSDHYRLSCCPQHDAQLETWIAEDAWKKTRHKCTTDDVNRLITLSSETGEGSREDVEVDIYIYIFP